ncbi:hypothetical protein OSB04_002859 [Centaurea solstitialis]|uniref:phosphoglycolate phosphatase n=1 Tax=Centaurea solstitialis TaxID=347529 RepID=A0AA38TTP5_9ASTR|nr:hypothetical protein OSB04_002859 [Centaurea solstitialis]
MGDQKSTTHLSPTNVRHLLDSLDAFLFDCDGVIWKGDTLIDGVPQTLEMLRSKGKKVVFVTNNSSKSRKQYAQKFQSLGIPVTEEEIFSSSFAAAMYLKVNNFPPEKKIFFNLIFVVEVFTKVCSDLKVIRYSSASNDPIFYRMLVYCFSNADACLMLVQVYAIGGEGIIEELRLAGYTGIGGPEDAQKTVQLKANTLFEHDKSVGAVVVGIDPYINYYKLHVVVMDGWKMVCRYGTLCIRENPGCIFIATNRDATGNMTDLQEWPGAGCMVAAVCGATGKEPIVVGKPSTFMMDFLRKKYNIPTSKMCMVGDRLDTDILFGQNAGCTTLLVLSVA